MAVDGKGYASSELQLAWIVETTIGTPVVTNAAYLNVDSVEMPDFGLTQVLDVRQGAGRTLKAVDAFTQEKATVKQIGFSGICDKTSLPLLIENCMASAVGTTPASYDVAYNYTPPELLHGAASGATKTYTVQVHNPE